MLITTIAPYRPEESQNLSTFRKHGWMPTLNRQQLLTASLIIFAIPRSNYQYYAPKERIGN